METSVRQHVHSAALRTLKAHNFSRSSSQALSVLTDVLVRYLDLLALSCVQQGEHAGRRNPNVFDAVMALEEVGMGVEELMEFLQAEAKDLARYSLVKAGGEETAAGPSTLATSLASTMAPAGSSASRKIDSLADIKSSISQGARLDSDDAILLRYERIPTPDLSQTASPHQSPSPMLLGSPSSSPSSNGFHSLPNVINGSRPDKGKQREVEPLEDAMDISPIRLQTSPKLPLSPVSIPSYSPPSSPTHKRSRTSDWDPPDHVPEFLPPFPGREPHSKEDSAAFNILQSEPPLKGLSPRQRPPPPPRLPLLSNVKSTYTKAIPYSHSSLATSLSARDLPPDIISAPPSSSQTKSSASLQPLIAAYNILQSETQPGTNPSRLKVAHYLSRSGPQRYTNPDTLFGSSAPNMPRLLAPVPTHPVPLKANATGILPLPQPKSVTDNRHGGDGAGGFDWSMQHLHSNLAKLGKELVPLPMYIRTNMLPPPPPLFAPANAMGPADPNFPPQPLLYSRPIDAPWNSDTAMVEDVEDAGSKRKKRANERRDERSAMRDVVPDAQLYATWDWAGKDYSDSLAIKRGRMDAYSIGGNTNVGNNASSNGFGGGSWGSFGNGMLGSPMAGTPLGMKSPMLLNGTPKSSNLGGLPVSASVPEGLAKHGSDETIVASSPKISIDSPKQLVPMGLASTDQMPNGNTSSINPPNGLDHSNKLLHLEQPPLPALELPEYHPRTPKKTVFLNGTTHDVSSDITDYNATPMVNVQIAHVIGSRVA